MSTFTVAAERSGRTVLETDDWVAAQSRALASHHGQSSTAPWLHVRGTHHSHQWGPPHEGQCDRSLRCVKCGGWDNGSYGSQLPCGYDTRGRALAAIIEDELAEREVPGPCQ
jgi:hypothetical protein